MPLNHHSKSPSVPSMLNHTTPLLLGSINEFDPTNPVKSPRVPLNPYFETMTKS